MTGNQTIKVNVQATVRPNPRVAKARMWLAIRLCNLAAKLASSHVDIEVKS